MFDVHTVTTNAAGAAPSQPDRILAGFFRDISFPAAAAALTVLGAITAGTGFTSLPTLAPSGGTLTAGVSPADPAVAIATSLKAVTATVLTAGTGVAINDTFTAAGGTLAQVGAYYNGSTTIPVPTKVTVTHIKVVTATVAAAGTGGTPGAVTVTGTTGTGTKWQGTGVIDGGGLLTGPITVTVAGDYTVTPTLAGDAVTGGSLSGATVAVTMGALTLSITNAGGYTIPPATANTPANTVGTGTGVTLTLAFGLGTALLLHSGNYSSAPGFAVTGGAGSGASLATGTLGGNGNAIPRQIAAQLPTNGLLPTSTAPVTGQYQATGNLNAQQGYVTNVYKSNLGLTVALWAKDGSSTLAAGTFDVLTLG